jgi:hypothetical protein
MKQLKFLLTFIISLITAACHYTETQFKDTDFTKAEIKTEIVEIQDGFGFEIWVDGKKYINLNAIPHVKAYKPFPDSVIAHQAADMVVQKLRKKIIPPYLTVVI